MKNKLYIFIFLLSSLSFAGDPLYKWVKSSSGNLECHAIIEGSWYSKLFKSKIETIISPIKCLTLKTEIRIERKSNGLHCSFYSKIDLTRPGQSEILPQFPCEKFEEILKANFNLTVTNTDFDYKNQMTSFDLEDENGNNQFNIETFGRIIDLRPDSEIEKQDLKKYLSTCQDQRNNGNKVFKYLEKITNHLEIIPSEKALTYNQFIEKNSFSDPKLFKIFPPNEKNERLRVLNRFFLVKCTPNFKPNPKTFLKEYEIYCDQNNISYLKFNRKLDEGGSNDIFLAISSEEPPKILIYRTPKQMVDKKKRERQIININQYLMKLKSSNISNEERPVIAASTNVIITPYFKDGDLYNFVTKKKVESREIQEEIIESLIHEVNNFHSYGFAHGDIKPENFFLKSENGKFKVKLSDFDQIVFNKDYDVKGDPMVSLTTASYIYLPPKSPFFEQLEFSNFSNWVKSDIWASCLTILDILSSGVGAQEIYSLTEKDESNEITLSFMKNVINSIKQQKINETIDKYTHNNLKWNRFLKNCLQRDNLKGDFPQI